MTEKHKKSFLSELFKAPPAKPGESYDAPEQGKSAHISVITTITILALWYMATWNGAITLPGYGAITWSAWIKPLYLPSPGQVISRFFDILQEEYVGATLPGHLYASLRRIFLSLFLGIICAIPIGIFMGINRWVRGIFDPVLEFYRPIPPLAYLPLTIIWLGIGETQKNCLIFLAVLAPMALNTRAGVRAVAIERIHAAYSLGASKLQVILHVILPSAMPEILTGIRIAVGFGWTTLVAAELVGARRGLGNMTMQASEFLNTDAVFVGIIIIGVIAYLFDLLMRYLENMLVPWKGRG